MWSLLLMGMLAQNPCQEHIELFGGDYWARELGKPEMWVLEHHRINLWQNAEMPRGKKQGEMRVGSRAPILEERGDAYKVRSPLDNSLGWVSKIQVKTTLWQDVNTRRACKP